MLSSDRLALMRPLITPGARTLMLKRLTNHVALIDRRTKLSEKRKAEIKIALLLVHILNPFEEFFATEEALMRGIDEKTLAKRKQEKTADGRLSLKRL